MPWKGRLLMLSIGVFLGMSTLCWRGYLAYGLSSTWSGSEEGERTSEFSGYFATPLGSISGGLVLLSVIVFALTTWSIYREDSGL